VRARRQLMHTKTEIYDRKKLRALLSSPDINEEVREKLRRDYPFPSDGGSDIGELVVKYFHAKKGDVRTVMGGSTPRRDTKASSRMLGVRWELAFTTTST
jgi:hypothetical protein